MIIVDTHCHLDFPDFDRDREEVITRAAKGGVRYIINIGSSPDSSRRSLSLAGQYKGIFATVGIHPHYARDTGGKLPGELEELSRGEKVVAIGEVGLDYYRDISPGRLQRELFRRFTVLARETGLPLVIHSRDAHRDTLSILKSEYGSGIRGVMHCFSGDGDTLKECLDLGLHISFAGNMTFPGSEALRLVASAVPVERLLLETDAPYMSPQGHRGKRNEPSYLGPLIDEHARLQGLSREDIARITTHNAKTLFGLPIEEKPAIAYAIRDSLYLNITNRCTDNCSFCVRNFVDFVKGHNLRLEREPATEELLEAIGDPTGYKEVVFCGYGEPTLRLDVVKEVARAMKKKGMPVRMVTNGEGDLINKRSIARELTGLVDKVSVSLNVDAPDKYDAICKSRFGAGVFEKAKKFALECRDAGMDVEATFLDLPGVDISRCERIARDELGVRFRMRKLEEVG
jgi:TatD DNase family protein